MINYEDNKESKINHSQFMMQYIFELCHVYKRKILIEKWKAPKNSGKQRPRRRGNPIKHECTCKRCQK